MEASKGRLLSSEVKVVCLRLEYRLSKYIIGKRKGQTVKTEDELQLMHNLVAEYSNFENSETHMSASSTAEGLNDKSDGQVVASTPSPRPKPL